MLRSVYIFLLVGLAFAHSIGLPKATPEQLERFSQFSRKLNMKVQDVKDAPTTLMTGSQCFVQDDCPRGQSCVDVEGALHDYLSNISRLHEFNRLKRKTRIFGKECVVSKRDLYFGHSLEELQSQMVVRVEEMNTILNDSKTGVGKYGIDSNRLVISHLAEETDILPITRQNGLSATGTSGINPLFLILALRGTDGGLNIDNNLILLLLLTQSQQPGGGVDQNFLSNPFLLYTLLGNNNSNNDNSNLLLLLLTLSPNGGLGGLGGLGGTGGTDGSSDLALSGTDVLANPLILFTLLGSNSGDNFSNLLLLFTLSGGLGRGLGGDAGDSGSPLGGGIESLLPLLLLSGGGTGDNSDSLLLILLLTGNSLDSGSPQSGVNNLIPLLFLTNSSLADDNLILLLALSGGLGGPNTPDLNDPYGGGLASIIPLLIFAEPSTSTSTSTGSSSSLLPLLFLTGGLGGQGGDGAGLGTNIQSLLPFLLLQDSGSDNTLLLLVLLSSFSQTPAGLAPLASTTSA